MMNGWMVVPTIPVSGRFPLIFRPKFWHDANDGRRTGSRRQREGWTSLFRRVRRGRGGTEGDLLSEVRDRYADEDGPELKKELADIANTIWRKGRDPTVLKDVLQSFPRPRNVACHKVDINPEVLVGLLKKSKLKDLRLRAAQSSVARTCGWQKLCCQTKKHQRKILWRWRWTHWPYCQTWMIP